MYNNEKLIGIVVNNPKEYTSRRIFYSIDEIKMLPALKNVDWSIFSNFCALPYYKSLKDRTLIRWGHTNKNNLSSKSSYAAISSSGKSKFRHISNARIRKLREYQQCFIFFMFIIGFKNLKREIILLSDFRNSDWMEWDRAAIDSFRERLNASPNSPELTWVDFGQEAKKNLLVEKI